MMKVFYFTLHYSQKIANCLLTGNHLGAYQREQIARAKRSLKIFDTPDMTYYIVNQL